MNEVNKTLFIPLYGKAMVSKQGMILKDDIAEKIWEQESFPISGKSASKWLALNMAMRARVFDDWTESLLNQNRSALVIQIGCGLDGRCLRVKTSGVKWIDADLDEVISLRRKYYTETEAYRMIALDASNVEQLKALPSSDVAIVVLEGLSMYLTNEQIQKMLCTLKEKYSVLHVLMDVYTKFGAAASKYKNPVNDVGVMNLYGIGSMESVLENTGLRVVARHSLTPDELINELKPSKRFLFRMLFTGRLYSKIYRLYELGGI